MLVLKWGGELTPSGRIQAEELGRVFRCMYPGGQGKHLVHTKTYFISLIGCKWSFRFYNASSLSIGFSKSGKQFKIRKNGIFSKTINSKFVSEIISQYHVYFTLNFNMQYFPLNKNVKRFPIHYNLWMMNLVKVFFIVLQGLLTTKINLDLFIFLY